MSNKPRTEDAEFPAPSVAARPFGLEALGDNWGWFLALGIILMVVGTLAIGSSLIATLATVVAFGTLLLVAGAVQFVGAFCCRKWNGFFTELLTGVFYLAVGLLMVSNPLRAAAALTLMVAAFLLVGGILRVVVAVNDRFEGWGWVLLSGLVTALLGILIWRQWPWSGLWVIGLFVGIEMIFCGWKWVMLAMAARRLGSLGDSR